MTDSRIQAYFDKRLSVILEQYTSVSANAVIPPMTITR